MFIYSQRNKCKKRSSLFDNKIWSIELNSSKVKLLTSSSITTNFAYTTRFRTVVISGQSVSVEIPYQGSVRGQVIGNIAYTALGRPVRGLCSYSLKYREKWFSDVLFNMWVVKPGKNHSTFYLVCFTRKNWSSMSYVVRNTHNGIALFMSAQKMEIIFLLMWLSS